MSTATECVTRGPLVRPHRAGRSATPEYTGGETPPQSAASGPEATASQGIHLYVPLADLTAALAPAGMVVAAERGRLVVVRVPEFIRSR
jgi:hypothetical protein